MRVCYLELRSALASVAYVGPERIGPERMDCASYLALYRRVGESVSWDQRLSMPREALESLLGGDALAIYVARDHAGEPLGLCEFDRRAFPDIELKNFGLVPAAQGRGERAGFHVFDIRDQPAAPL